MELECILVYQIKKRKSMVAGNGGFSDSAVTRTVSMLGIIYAFGVLNTLSGLLQPTDFLYQLVHAPPHLSQLRVAYLLRLQRKTAPQIFHAQQHVADLTAFPLAVV